MEDSYGQYRKLLEDALARARSESNPLEEGKVLLDLGFLHADALDEESAARCFEEGLSRLKSTPHYASCLPALFRLARLYRVRRLDDRAYALYTEIAELAEKCWDKKAQALGLAFKGNILLGQGSHENGLEFLFRGFQILEEAKLKESREVLDLIRDHRRRMTRGIFDLALAHSRMPERIKALLRPL
jgi:tetratricopeptide (TPR) repeat protein